MRNRISEERISAPPTFGMESTDFHKFGRRNLGARLQATTSGAPTGLQNYSPQPIETMYISFVSLRVSDSMWLQEVHPPDNTKSTKTTAALGDEKPTLANQWGRGRRGDGGWGTQKRNTNALQTQPFSVLAQPSSPRNCAQERENEKTDIFKSRVADYAKPSRNRTKARPPQQN